MARKKQEEMRRPRTGNIHARIVDQRKGLQVIENVFAVRVLSEKYRLLIMEDYTPILGKVEGDVVILSTDGEITYGNIYAFFKLQHNEFTLLIDHEIMLEKECET